MLTTEEKRARCATELAEIKQRIAENDSQAATHAEEFKRRRLALLETGLRLEGRLATLDEVLRESVEVISEGAANLISMSPGDHMDIRRSDIEH